MNAAFSPSLTWPGGAAPGSGEAPEPIRAGVAKQGNSVKMRALAQGALSLPLLVRGLMFATLYFAAMVLAIALTRFGALVSPIWIASAVLAWALITAPTREWPVLVALTALAHALGAIAVGDQWTVELVYLAANLSSPLILASLMRWRGDELDFPDRGVVLRFLLFAGVAAPGASALIAAAGTALIDPSQLNLRFTLIWYLADGLSFVVFLPIAHAIASGDWAELFKSKARTRAAALFAALVLAHLISYAFPGDLYRFFLLLLVPYVVYIAYDLGLTGARAAIAVSATMIVIYALFAPVREGRNMAPQEYLLAMQVYLAALSASVLPLAAALAEKQRLYETASQALDDAQAAWGELIAAEAHYRLIADNADDIILRLDLNGDILFASPACRALNAAPESLEGRALADLAHADDGARCRAAIAALVAAGEVDAPKALQVRLPSVDGDWRLFDLRATLVAPSGGEPGEIIAVLRRVQT